MWVELLEPDDPKPATRGLIVEISTCSKRVKDDVDFIIVFKDSKDNEYLYELVPSPEGTLAVKITSKIRNEDQI